METCYLIDERLITRKPLLGILSELESNDATKVTLYLAPTSSVSDNLPADLKAWLNEYAELVSRPRNGVALFWSSAEAYLLEPPLPFLDNSVYEGWNTRSLRAQLTGQFKIGVVLLRLGGYAVGVFDGDKLVESKVGSRFVKNRHRKGGQSQRRYDRTREKQIREHFDRLCDAMRAHLEPFAADLDYVILGGDGHTVEAFLDRCPLSKELKAKMVPRFLTVPEPRLAVLKATLREIWQSRLWQFTELR